MSNWQPDVLGTDFEQLPLPLPGGRRATLVRYLGQQGASGPNPATAAAKTAGPTAANAAPNADVLYVHGWSDYFFQRELAQFWHAQGATFYAVDLHGYGRNLSPAEIPGQIQSLNEYDADIHAALIAMGRAVVESAVDPHAEKADPDPGGGDDAEPQHPGGLIGWIQEAIAALTRPRVEESVPGRRPLILLGHSTGGLTLSLWAKRHPAMVDALILNSPWLEFQASEVGRAVVTPFIEARNRLRPRAPMPGVDPGFYARTVSAKFDGEWEYNTLWRPERGFAVTASFLSAVFKGQATIARGLGLDIPVLVMLSDRSYLQPRWSREAMEADVVLNVETVARRAPDLGRDLTLHRISGAFHDVFLSPPEIREHAYAGMRRWIKAALTPED